MSRDQVYYKTDEEVELIRKSSLLVGKTLAECAKLIKPGVKTTDLDKVAEAFIRDHGAEPGFKGYGGFPATLCISRNEVVVHGFPTDEPLKEGEIVSVDCGVLWDGFYGDCAYTFPVGEIAPEVAKLLEVTKSCLYKGIEQAIAGNRLGDIGFAVQHEAESNGFSVVRDLVGHGIGRNLHEEPQVANYGRRGRGSILRDGLCIAIEPMINQGKKEVVQESDGWTIRTIDRLPSAHYEHTVVVRKGKAEILSTHEYVEEVLNSKTTA